jgi:hypothetical protein
VGPEYREYWGPRASGEDPTKPHVGPSHWQLQALLAGPGHAAGTNMLGGPQGTVLKPWATTGGTLQRQGDVQESGVMVFSSVPLSVFFFFYRAHPPEFVCTSGCVFVKL